MEEGHYATSSLQSLYCEQTNFENSTISPGSNYQNSLLMKNNEISTSFYVTDDVITESGSQASTSNENECNENTVDTSLRRDSGLQVNMK